jgi:clan AA aspartic protease
MALKKTRTEVRTMVIIKTDIMLGNPISSTLKPIEVEAIVDPNALHLWIPRQVADQLQLKETSKRKVTTAEGKKRICPYVGPLEIKFKNRTCFSGAVVTGDEVRLGHMPMDDLDLVVSPKKMTVVIKPESPLTPMSEVKTKVGIPLKKYKVDHVSKDAFIAPDDDDFVEF